MVSIIVPVYNTEKYLGCCLQSLIGQSYTDIEIVVVNDGSTDASTEIIGRFASRDERFKVIEKQNGGLPSAVCAGIQAANGEYIIFVDSDDYVGENFVNNFVSELDGCDVLCMGFNYDRGGDINQYFLKKDFIYRGKDLEILRRKFIFDGYFDNSNLIFVARWNKIYRASVLKEYAGLYALLGLKLYEDAFFTLLLLNRDVSIKTLKSPNEYYYNISDISTTRKVKTIAEFENTVLKINSAEKLLLSENINCYDIADILVSYAGMEHIKDYSVRFDNKEAVVNIEKIVKNENFIKALDFFSYSKLNLRSGIKLYLCKHGMCSLLYRCMK